MNGTAIAMPLTGKIAEAIKKENIVVQIEEVKDAVLASPHLHKIISEPVANITLPPNAPVVHTLVPNLLAVGEVRSEAERISHNYGKEEYITEIRRILALLGRRCILYLCSLTDYQFLVDQIPPNQGEILQLCDGSDVDGVPGPCVSAYLEEKGLRYYGCNKKFLSGTVSKTHMKNVFVQHHVSTAKFASFTRNRKPLPQDFEGMRYPLFVKAADSYACIGLSKESVVNNFEEACTQVEKMLPLFANVLVEEFILGAEFTVLIIGNATNLTVYPPAQRNFDTNLAPEDRFLSFKLVWEEGGRAYQYGPVTDETTSKAVADLARRAYLSVGGNGFGRVDIRRRDATGEFFILEVNATCGIGWDSTSTQILKLCGHDEVYMIECLLAIGKADPN